jgi:LacI family transcriptional regulator
VAKAGKPVQGATIIDVAARAGVSAMTVSRVINGRSGVSAATREAVERAIAELSYVPNVAARSLVTSAELRIGVVYSNPSAAFMSELLTGVFEEASTWGARLVLLKGEGGRPPAEAELARFAASGLSGILLAPPLAEAPVVLRTLKGAGVPIAAIGAYRVPGATCVRIDDRRAAYEMTRHLLDLGHRRLGFVIGNPDQAASAERRAGVEDAMRDFPDAGVQLVQGDFSYASGLAAGEELLDGPAPPTAVFASNDDMAAAIVSVAHRRQLDVPRQLTVVGFDDTTAAVTLWPPLTTIHQPVRRLAAEALALVADEARGASAKTRTRRDRVLEHEIVKRSSTAAPPEG